MSLTKRTLHIHPTKEEFGIREPEKKPGGKKDGGSTAGGTTRGGTSGNAGTKKPAGTTGSTGKKPAGTTGGTGKKPAGTTGGTGKKPAGTTGGTGKKPAGASGSTETKQQSKKGGCGTYFLLLIAVIIIVSMIESCPGKDDSEDQDSTNTGLSQIELEDIFVPADSSSSGTSSSSASYEEDTSDTYADDTDDETDNAYGSLSEWSQAVREISEPGYVWQTASSIAARKQFWDDKILNYAGGQDDPYAYELISVTNLTGIDFNHGDGVKYAYLTNTGNEYYLYEDNEDLLECHWEPDGYSGSDSLEKVPDNITENTEMIKMDSSETTGLTFNVRSISVFSGYYNDSDKETCLAINLETPVYVRKTDGTDGAVHSIQIWGDAVDSFSEARGLNFEIGEADGYVVENTRLQVTGDLYEPDTNHHYTPLIMHVTGGLY